MAITLKQGDILTLKDFEEGKSKYRKSTKLSGAYVWGFSMEDQPYTIPSFDKFFPYYVGIEMSNLYSRFYEHLCCLNGGAYPIFDIKSAYSKNISVGKIKAEYEKNLKKNSSSTITFLPDTFLYFPEGCHLYKTFKENVLIRETIDWMNKHIVFLYLHDENSTKKALQTKKDYMTLEIFLSNLFDRDKLIGKSKSKTLPNDYSLNINRLNDEVYAIVNAENLFENLSGDKS